MNNLPETSCFRNIFSLMHFLSIKKEDAPACQNGQAGEGTLQGQAGQGCHCGAPCDVSGSVCMSNLRGNKGVFLYILIPAISWEYISLLFHMNMTKLLLPRAGAEQI